MATTLEIGSYQNYLKLNLIEGKESNALQNLNNKFVDYSLPGVLRKLKYVQNYTIILGNKIKLFVYLIRKQTFLCISSRKR